MNTDNNEAERLEAVNQELCRKLVDLEAEIERKNKTLEGFIAENEALKAELGGKVCATNKTGQATVPGSAAVKKNSEDFLGWLFN